MSSGWRWALLLTAASIGCQGTETGNPPTRGVDCSKVVCVPCAPPIVLHVTDATSGGPVPALSIDGDASVCAPQDSDTVCTLDGGPYATPDLHTLQLAAPGYEPLSVDVSLDASPSGTCCDCGYTPTQLDVTLSPLPGGG